MKTLISIAGTTGIGKTSLAIKLAKELGTEIISCDSRQFYREMPIGTAAPTKEELLEVPHHFIGERSVVEPISIGEYEHQALERITELFNSYDSLILVGGSMMYEKAVTEGLDDLPEADPKNQENLLELWNSKGLEALAQLLKEVDPEYYNKADLNNPRRLLRAIDVSWQTSRPYSELLDKSKKSRPFQTIQLGISAPREVIYERINTRVDLMIESGLVEEAKMLLPYKDLPSLKTVGYTELFAYFDGQFSLEKAVEEIKKNSRRFAKRQLTWYRKEESRYWVDYTNAFLEAKEYLSQKL